MKQDRLIPLRVSRTLNAQPKSLTQSEKSAIYFYKNQGMRAIRPSWPNLIVYDEDTNEFTFVEVKRMGDRLSQNQMETFRMLVKLGLKVEVAIVTPMGEAFAIPFNLEDVHLRIPKRLFFQKRPSVIHTRKQPAEPFEPFEPSKHNQFLEEGSKNFDKEVEKKFEEDMEWMKPLLKQTKEEKKEAKQFYQGDTFSKIEALPEEAPNLERKVRVVGEDNQTSEK